MDDGFVEDNQLNENGSENSQRNKKSRIKIIHLNCPQPDCKETFTKGVDIKRHLYKDHQILPYRCYFKNCDKVFESRLLVTRHRKNDHKGKQLFRCTLCTNEFRTFKALQVHQWRFHEIGLFECDADNGKCKKQTKTRDLMDKHYYIYHSGGFINGIFSCEMCSLSFNSIYLFKIHQRKVHKVISKSNNFFDVNTSDDIDVSNVEQLLPTIIVVKPNESQDDNSNDGKDNSNNECSIIESVDVTTKQQVPDNDKEEKIKSDMLTFMKFIHRIK
ncbi:hypothetical protein RDWZM_004637 [Blomia tropicalis]|uniref:C2H2-type domain-containing protein n=1 Tax=Blomia tropicalis TaxID=40697 RepID=A0A9Q0M7K7_BLOTA|nr:hypothetical protein RDWZM_004637 [Blomia tropicalis]